MRAIRAGTTRTIAHFCSKTCRTSRIGRAHFTSAIALVFPDGREVTALGQTDGEILFEERGTGGFGYDSLFYSYDLKKSFGEATDEEKNSVSHRGRALAALEAKI